MTTKKSDCPYCKGTKFLGTGVKEKIVNGRRVLYPYTLPCYCVTNNAIVKAQPMLSRAPEAHPKDAKKIHLLYGKSKKQSGNVLFLGDEALFLYIVRCFFLQGFTHRNYLILESPRIIEKYHTVQKDESWPSVAALLQYDLLALLFTSPMDYKNLKSCVLDVIQNRNRQGLPTWVYAQSDEALKTSREYTSELEPFLKNYTRADLSKMPKLEGYQAGAGAGRSTKRSVEISDGLGSI